jgi:uncharacterized iron-regulated protein
MKKFEITEQMAQQIADYLVKQPFKDVVQLIGMLQNLREIPQVVVPQPNDTTD